MNCAIHTETPAVAYCRTCGKALCATCKRQVLGVVYCENCIAARLQGTMPSIDPKTPGATPVVIAAVPGTPNPGLALGLGFIPGVGAMYNGQYAKGFLHVAIFGCLIWAADHGGDIFGVLIPFWIFYMVIDAYRTAKALQLGQTPPDPLGLNAVFPSAATTVPSAGSPVAPAGDGTVAPVTTAPARFPLGAIILIGIGVLFLLENLGVFRLRWISQLWPLLLIAIGVNIVMRRQGGGWGRNRNQGGDQ